MVLHFRASPSDRPWLKVGLLLDGPQLSAFCARVIEDIQRSNFATIDFLVFRKTVPSASNGVNKSPFEKLTGRLFNPQLRRHVLYDAYLRLDRRMKPAGHPLDSADCAPMLAGVENIEVEPIGKKFVHRFPADAIDKIRARNLDVLLRFGFNILHGEILQSARYGVWSYHHGDNEFYRGGPPHFWELYEGSPLSGVVLQVLSEELDGGLVLCKSLFATQKTISVSRNRFVPYWGSTDLVIRKLNELHQFGWEYVQQRALPPAPYQGKRKIYRAPTNIQVARWLGPAFLKKVLRNPFHHKKTVQHWRIALRRTGSPLFDCSPNAGLEGFRWIEPAKGHFCADPFAVEVEGKCWLFFEDYSYQQGRAAIACAEISPEGALVSQQRCLEQAGRHYSYPHVFWAGGELFMVPETVDSRSVDLYRCQEFPNRWVRETALMQGQFVDTTIWEHDGLWWLLTTSAEPDSRAGCLLLFFAESLAGTWHFHPANPISTDIRNNRGAGRVFATQGRLIRPSQSGSPIYGHSITLNEITELSSRHYAERPVRTISPDFWRGLGLCGVHTYARVGNTEIIDGQTAVSLAS